MYGAFCQQENHMNTEQRIAVAKLIGSLEGVVEGGLCGDKTEMKLRRVIAEALVAFNLPSITEMKEPHANH